MRTSVPSAETKRAARVPGDVEAEEERRALGAVGAEGHEVRVHRRAASVDDDQHRLPRGDRRRPPPLAEAPRAPCRAAPRPAGHAARLRRSAAAPQACRCRRARRRASRPGGTARRAGPLVRVGGLAEREHAAARLEPAADLLRLERRHADGVGEHDHRLRRRVAHPEHHRRLRGAARGSRRRSPAHTGAMAYSSKSASAR